MNNKHTPLFHIRKRGMLKWYQVWKIRLIAILLALIVDAVITTLVTGLNPIDVYATIFKGSFGTPRKFWVMMQNVAIMLCVSIAITPAYKMRFWNVGGEGQILIGALVSAACMILLGNKLPSWLIIVLSFMLSTLAGAIWALIPALFNAKLNNNYNLLKLIINYVATQLVAFFIIKWEVPKGAGKIGIINQSTESGWLPTIFDNKYLLNILIVFVLTILVHIYLRYSKHGYELSVVGESERTARYIGLNVEKVIMRTLLLSGALCGIAGFLLVAGTNHTVTTTIAGGRGFTAVMVAWLANFKPLGMIITSFLIIFMDRGAGDISSNFGLNASFSDIITGIILFFIIASEFFIRYEIVWRKKENKEEPVQEAPIDETAKATLDEAGGKEE